MKTRIESRLRLLKAGIGNISKTDIISAKAIDLTAIGVYGSLDNKDALKGAGADFLVKDISEIPELLERIHL